MGKGKQAPKRTDAEKADFLVALAQLDGNLTGAARVVGIPRSTAKRWADRAKMAGLSARTIPSHTEEVPEDAPWYDDFFRVLAATANTTRAAELAGVSRRTVYDHRILKPDFARRWDEAEAIADDAVIEEVRRRAIEGVMEPVFYRGEECGEIRRYSDHMLAILARQAHGGKYRENGLTLKATAEGDSTGLILEMHVAGAPPE